MEKFFSIYGKATRSEYWGVICISLIAATVCMFILALLISAANTETTDIIGGIVVILVGATTLYAQLSVAARRCRDIGINPWFSLTVIVPYVGMIPFVVFGCLPASKN